MKKYPSTNHVLYESTSFISTRGEYENDWGKRLCFQTLGEMAT